MDPRDNPWYWYWVWDEGVRRNQKEENANYFPAEPYVPFSERGKLARFFRVIGYTIGTIFWIVVIVAGLWVGFVLWNA